MKTFCLLVLMLLAGSVPAVLAQTGVITGLVRDRNTQQPLVGAALLLESTTLGTVTDPEGRLRVEKIPVGSPSLYIWAHGRQQRLCHHRWRGPPGGRRQRHSPHPGREPGRAVAHPRLHR